MHCSDFCLAWSDACARLDKGGGGCDDYLTTNEGGTRPPDAEGLMIMTTYNTATLTAALMGDDAIDTPAAKKANTRIVRKFLRDELGNGKAVVGKGARYALDYNKRELTALAKKFKAWEAQQEAEKIARAEARAAAANKAPETDIEDDAPIADDEDNADTELEGPTDAELAEMLTEIADED